MLGTAFDKTGSVVRPVRLSIVIPISLILIFLLLYLTSPTATHALVKGAIAGGLRPVGRDLSEAAEQAGNGPTDAAR